MFRIAVVGLSIGCAIALVEFDQYAVPVGAVLNDASTTTGNTFSTAAVFAGVRTFQTGSVTSAAVGNITDTLPIPIDPTRSFLIFSTRHNATDAPDALVRGRILNNSTVQFGRVTLTTAPIEIEYTVIEYFSGVQVQRGTVSQAITPLDVPITAVASTSQAFVTWSKTPGISDTGFDSDDPIVLELTSTSNLQIRSETPNANHTIWWEIVEFTNAPEILVQKGSTSLIGGSAIANIPLPTGVDVTRAFPLVSYTTNGSGNDVGARLLRAQLVDGNNLQIERSLGGDADDITEIFWQVVELNNGASVQRGLSALPTSTAVDTDTITSVNLSRSVAFSGVQFGAGQSGGRASLNTSTTTGVASATFSFPSASQVQVERANTNAPAEFGWFVVQF